MLIQKSHVTHESLNESCHTQIFDTQFVSDMTPSNAQNDAFPHSHVQHDAFIHATYTKFDLHTIRVWYDSFKCAKWCIPMCNMTHLYMQLDSHRHCCQYRSWCVCAMTHSYLWHDSFICATWLIPVCDMTRVYVQHDSFSCAIWRIHMCKLRHFYGRQDSSCVQHDSFTCVTRVLFRKMIASPRARAHTHSHTHMHTPPLPS